MELYRTMVKEHFSYVRHRCH